MADSNLQDVDMEDIDANSPPGSPQAVDKGPEPRTKQGIPAMRSVEGWVVVGTGIHEETDTETVHDFFSDFGQVKQVQLNLDRRTGFAKGYVLVQYATLKEAAKAVENGNGMELFEQKVTIDYAFTRPQHTNTKRGGGRPRESRGGRGNRDRSRSRSRSPGGRGRREDDDDDRD